VFLALLFAACSKKVLPTSATWEGNTYQNQFFNFQMQVPQGWAIGNTNGFERALAAENPGQKLNQKVDKEKGKIWHPLLLASETPAGTPAESNPKIVLGVVDISGEPNVQNAKDFESSVAQTIVGRQRTWKQVNDPFLVRLGSKEFYRVDFKIDDLGRIRHKAYFATIERRYVLLLTVTADSETDVNRTLTLAGLPQAGK
jgi:hypothetical protein